MAARLLSLGALLALWIVAAHFGDPRRLPGPVAVFAEMEKAAASGELFAAMAITMARVAAAFTLAMALGSALGYAMGGARSSTVSPIRGSSCSSTCRRW